VIPQREPPRFELADPDERTYRVERWCFRESIDNWIPLHHAGPLDEVVAKSANHLDQESFYELMQVASCQE
jgi:hypothetical protein